MTYNKMALYILLDILYCSHRREICYEILTHILLFSPIVFCKPHAILKLYIVYGLKY